MLAMPAAACLCFVILSAATELQEVPGMPGNREERGGQARHMACLLSLTFFIREVKTHIDRENYTHCC